MSTMSTTFPADARIYLERMSHDPRLRELSRIPLVPLPTVFVIGAAYALCATAVWGFVAHSWPAWLATIVSAIGIFLSFTPYHDATHRAASRHRVLNDRLGDLSGTLLFPGLGTSLYRRLHLEHHRFQGEPEQDPDDFFVSAPWYIRPVTWLFLDVKWTIWVVRRWRRYRQSFLLPFVAGMSVLVAWHVAWLLSSHAREFIILWLIPQRLALFSLAYFFAVIQHPPGKVQRREPLQSTMMISGGTWKGVALLGQNRHLMHHMFPSLPFYRCQAVWRLSEPLLSSERITWRGTLTPARPWHRGAPGAAPTTQLLGVSAKQELHKDVILVTLQAADGALLAPFTAGAHVDVHLTRQGAPTLVRQYSLLGDPDDRRQYLIAIKREAKGRGGSQRAHELLSAGASIEVGLPRNRFPLDESAADVQLIGAGIGITPLLAMAHHLHRLGKSFSLHVCASAPELLAFDVHLAAAPFSGRVVRHFGLRSGGMTDLCLALGEYKEGRAVYVCGPQGFMEDLQQRLSKAGWSEGAIHHEDFVPARSVEALRPFQVKLQRSGKTVAVGADSSLLRALTNAGCDIPASCEQGFCGSCRTRVVAGVPEHHDSFFGKDESAREKEMLICVSRGRENEELVLDL